MLFKDTIKNKKKCRFEKKSSKVTPNQNKRTTELRKSNKHPRYRLIIRDFKISMEIHISL